MSYHLVNIDTLDYYYCDDNVWIAAIEFAGNNDWYPAGTFYDYLYDTNDLCYGNEDRLYYLFTLIMNQNDSWEWDGNYIEKKNQIVTYEDTIYLPLCLKGGDAPQELIDFIQKGSFRICSD